MSEDTAEKFESAPFGKPLEETEFGESLRQFQDNPNKLVYVRRTDLGEDPRKTVETYKRAEAIFDKLRRNYGIGVPNLTTVIGGPIEENLGRKQYRVYTIKDKVHGKTLEKSEIAKGPKGLTRKKVDSFFQNLIRFYMDVYHEGGDYLTDLDNFQFVYGRVAGEEKDRVYLVDIEPVFSAFDAENREVHTNWLYFNALNQGLGWDFQEK